MTTTDDNVTPIKKKALSPLQIQRNASVKRKRENPVIRQTREEEVLIRYVRGETQREIADYLGLTQARISQVLTEALNRRADMNPIIVRRARALLQERLDAMLGRWMPLALGVDGAPPDRDAALVTLKILDRVAKVNGVDMAPTMNVNVTATLDVDDLRSEVMASLDDAAARHRVIEGAVVDGEAPAS